MTLVVDASRKVGGQAAALAAAGVRTVFRYYTRDSPAKAGKRLHPTEASQLTAAGLRIGVVYEGAFGNTVDYFDHDAGLKDGTFARTYANHTIGQPAGSAIYFAFDANVDEKIIKERVIPYFAAVHKAMIEANGEPLYEIGVYGCGGTCMAVQDAGFVTKTWVSQSTKHYLSKEYRKSGLWTLDQQLPNSIAGVGCDPDKVNPNVAIGDFSLAPTLHSAPSYSAGMSHLWSENRFNDKVSVPQLIAVGSSKVGLEKAREVASAALPGYPHNGCAVHLCALLEEAGIDVKMTPSAGRIALLLEQRGWVRIAVGMQAPGDVGVCIDATPPVGADHVYLVLQVLADNQMEIADNQKGVDSPHLRYATAGHHKTKTDYFLRAT